MRKEKRKKEEERRGKKRRRRGEEKRRREEEEEDKEKEEGRRIRKGKIIKGESKRKEEGPWGAWPAWGAMGGVVKERRRRKAGYKGQQRAGPSRLLYKGLKLNQAK